MNKACLVTLFATVLLSGTAQAQSLEDPTRPPAYSTGSTAPEADTSEPTFTLTSTLVAPNRRQAVINGETLRVGQRIGDARLVGIAPDHVRLERGGETFTLRLLSVSIKKPRSSQSGGHP